MSSIEVSCTCYPSPPGGTTRCEGGQIAVCGTAGTETCQGRCVTVDPNLTSLEYTAALISEVTNSSFSTNDLEDNAEECVGIVYKLLESSQQRKAVSFRLDGQSYQGVSVGLTEVAMEKLGDAVTTLANIRQPSRAR